MERNYTKLSIRVSHLNIRLSVSFLLIRLIVIEFVFALVIIMGNFLVTYAGNWFHNWIDIMSFHTGVFVAFVCVKLTVNSLIIYQWMNEYYEIFPTHIVHRKGIYVKKAEKYIFSNITAVNLNQSFLGKHLNYGTIHMYDRSIYKNIYLRYVQNPQRYFLLLKSLMPSIDSQEVTVSENLDIPEDT